MKIKYFIISTIIIIATVFQANAQIYLIANKSVKDSTYTKSKIIDIYTLNRQYWDDGSKIIVVDYKGDNQLKNKYYKTMDLSYNQIQKIWLKKIFSGKALPPKTLKSEKEVIEFVANTEGAISYVTAKNLPDSVIVIAKIE